MARRALVELCQTADDWLELREIFARSFKKYPLFQYIVPNPEKRAEFVNNFIDANYQVHAADGSALPLIIRKLTGISQKSLFSPTMQQDYAKRKGETLGGVLFIEPAKDGIGWSNSANEVYVRSYKQHGLLEMDEQAFERLKIYEEWEAEHVIDPIFDMRIPMWNGMICAIDPKYAGNGIGREAFSECMKYLDLHHTRTKTSKDKKMLIKEKHKSKATVQENKNSHRLAMQGRKNSVENHNSYDCFATKVLRNLSLITHHPHHAFSLNTALSASSEAVLPPLRHKQPKKSSKKSSHSQPLVALSHCPRAVQFHTRNGFKCINKLQYYPPGQTTAAFDVYVLMTDVQNYL